MKNQLWKRLLCLTIALFAMGSSFFGTYEAAETKAVRVGIFSLGSFQGWDENGEPCGYNIDYLDKLAVKTNWSFEYVPCDNWVEATALLKNGDIDLLAPAQITPSLSAQFDYAALYMGTEAAAIYTSTSHEDLLYEDFDTMQLLTYGCVENSTFAKKFLSDYCADHGMNPKVLYYANTTEQQAALQNGEVDAIVTNIMFASDDLRLLGWFSPLPIYYITQQGNRALLDELDMAMMEMLVEEPEYTAKLESRYFPLFSNTYFTYEELEFIQSLPAITIGYQVNHAPLSDKDASTEAFTGITREILDKISVITGIQFTYEALPATNVTFDYLQEHNIHVLSNVEYNEANLSMKKMHLSLPYLKSEKVLVAKNELQFDSQSNLHIALATGSGTLASVITDIYPNFSIDAYATVEECFASIKKGSADGTMLNRYVADRTLENPLYSDLTVIPIQSLSDQLCRCTLDYGDDILADPAGSSLFLSVINKAIQQISTEELNEIIICSTSNAHYQMSLLDLLRKYQTTVITGSVLLLCCFGALLWAQRVKSVKNRELAGKNLQLADAVSQAERANDAKSLFLSRMSHEIRTPMNAIVGLTAIAKRHKEDPEKMENCLSKIDSSSKVLLNIINDVLDMSAIENNKLKIASTEFDIKQVLDGITTIYYSQCKAKGIEFTMSADISDEMLLGDSLRVNQILLNLVSNSYKFTGAGGRIEVVVSQKERREDTVFLRFSVSDTGCGMSQEMLKRLFKPFEQENATTAQKYGGSGLGLSIAKNLVDLMHGAIRVESELGKGTVFTVDIPFGITNHAIHMDPDKLHDLRALVVDDDPHAREYTAIVLERIGIRFDTASSGEEAVKMLTEERRRDCGYDICFIDWKMPGLSGFEVTKKIRELFDRNTIVIIVSAYDLSEVEDEAKAAGADLFVSKPLFQSTVFNLLMQLSGGKYTKQTADEAAYDFSGHRVLLAEDNDLNAEIAIELLEMVQMKADRADNGEEALRLFEASPSGTYDAILMDMQMPVMDGLEATRAIRRSEHPQAKSIPIYAMTANAFNDDVAKALSCGMNGHIAKPIDTTILYDALKAAVNGKN